MKTKLEACQHNRKCIINSKGEKEEKFKYLKIKKK